MSWSYVRPISSNNPEYWTHSTNTHTHSLEIWCRPTLKRSKNTKHVTQQIAKCCLRRNGSPVSLTKNTNLLISFVRKGKKSAENDLTCNLKTDYVSLRLRHTSDTARYCRLTLSVMQADNDGSCVTALSLSHKSNKKEKQNRRRGWYNKKKNLLSHNTKDVSDIGLLKFLCVVSHVRGCMCAHVFT